MRLSTQLHRSLFALPLLALALVGAGGESAVDLPVPVAAPAHALVASLDCAESLRPAGSRGLARMPGDIGALGRRLRCAT